MASSIAGLGHRIHLLAADRLVFAAELILRSQEEHAVALLQRWDGALSLCALLTRYVQHDQNTALDLPLPQPIPSHVALAHGHAWAVPKALGHLGGLVVVVAAGAEGRAVFPLVLRQAFDDHGRDGLVSAKIGARAAMAEDGISTLSSE